MVVEDANRDWLLARYEKQRDNFWIIAGQGFATFDAWIFLKLLEAFLKSAKASESFIVVGTHTKGSAPLHFIIFSFHYSNRKLGNKNSVQVELY